MEDPWGSPWASADTPSDNHPSPASRANAFLSPPPKAFFGNATSFSSQLAWSGNHENGLGILAPGGRGDGTEIQNDWGVWGESSAQPPRLSPRLSVSGKSSPLVWADNANPSPLLTTRSRSRTPSLLRHHSPDPWATEPSFMNRSKLDVRSSPNPTANNTPPIDTKGVDYFQASQVVTSSATESNRAKRAHSVVRTSFDGAGAIQEVDTPRTSCDLATIQESTSSKSDTAVRELPSRPSSTFTVDSQDLPDRQDSPITSIDEDQGGRFQKHSRKISSGPQELPDIKEGLDKAASEELSTTILQTQGHENLPETSEFEGRDGSLNSNDVPVSDGLNTQSSGHDSSELASTPKADSIHREGVDYMTATEAPPPRSRSINNKFASTTFDTNLTLVDKLFPSLTDSLANSTVEECSEVPSHLFSDSFTTISERKAWYRISRYGSSRKHNFGDDENYARVTWSTSQLHDDTIKTVRRWMEQDVYAGKAILGGAKRTGLFDWNSDAAPVKLDEVFRRKKSIPKLTRTATLPISGETTQPSPQEDRSYRNSTGITFAMKLPSTRPISMPVPSFNWDPDARPIPPPPATQLPQCSSQPQNLAPESGSASGLPRPSVSIQTTFTKQNVNEDDNDDEEEEDEEDEEDDEDDWGEMVSSPLVERNIQPNLAASAPFSALSETSSEGHSPVFPDVTEFVESKSPIVLTSEPIPYDLPAVSDLPVLDEPTEELKPATGDSSESPEHIAPLTNTSTQSSDCPQTWTLESIVEPETPSLDILTVPTPAIEVLSTTAPTVDIMTTPEPTDLPRDESHDSMIIQDILRNLPDLSYMLR